MNWSSAIATPPTPSANIDVPRTSLLVRDRFGGVCNDLGSEWPHRMLGRSAGIGVGPVPMLRAVRVKLSRAARDGSLRLLSIGGGPSRAAGWLGNDTRSRDDLPCERSLQGTRVEEDAGTDVGLTRAARAFHIGSIHDRTKRRKLNTNPHGFGKATSIPGCSAANQALGFVQKRVTHRLACRETQAYQLGCAAVGRLATRRLHGSS